MKGERGGVKAATPPPQSTFKRALTSHCTRELARVLPVRDFPVGVAAAVGGAPSPAPGAAAAPRGARGAGPRVVPAPAVAAAPALALPVCAVPPRRLRLLLSVTSGSAPASASGPALPVLLPPGLRLAVSPVVVSAPRGVLTAR